MTAEPGLAAAMPAEGAPPAHGPVLHLDGFDGPLELLLDLTQRQLIDLRRLSVVALAQQLAAELEGLHGVPIEWRAGWLVVAARLLHLRSGLRSGLDDLAPECDAPAGLEAILGAVRLAGHLARAAADWLEGRPQLGRDVFVRRHGRQRAASTMALMEACLSVLGDEDRDHAAVLPADRRDFRLWDFRQSDFWQSDFWRAGDALAHVRAQLGHLAQGRALTGLVPTLPEGPPRKLRLKAAVASTLVACLELARTGELQIDQACDLGVIQVSRAVA